MFLIVSTLFGYFYKEDLEVKMFTLFSFRLFDSKEDKSAFLYDTYVMYCDQDYAWAQKTLLVGLEYSGYKVFDKNRDSDYSELGGQIEDALTVSCRVIVVLSPNFLKDSNSLNEFDRVVAHSKNRRKGRFIIVVTLYPPNTRIVLESTEQHSPLIMYLKHRCYVDVHSKDFWNRLLFWMPKRNELPDSTAYIGYTQSAEYNRSDNLA